MRKKSKNNYGTFAVKNKRTPYYWGVVLFAVLSVVVYFGFINPKKKVQDNISTIPKVEANEIPGWWYKDNFGSSVCEKDNCKQSADPDNDKLTNSQEFFYHSDPLNRDTNGNGLTDGEDVAYNYDPSKAGKVTFDQAASDDEVVGESLLLDQDIKKVIQDLTSMDNVQVPKINDIELVITQDNTKQGIINYIVQTEEVIKNNFPDEAESFIATTLESKDDEQVADLKLRITRTIIDYKKISVPSDALQLHKYQIGSFQTSLAVITVPPVTNVNDVSDPAANFWYDQVQTYAFLGQQVQLETKKLKDKYQW